MQFHDISKDKATNSLLNSPTRARLLLLPLKNSRTRTLPTPTHLLWLFGCTTTTLPSETVSPWHNPDNPLTVKRNPLTVECSLLTVAVSQSKILDFKSEISASFLSQSYPIPMNFLLIPASLLYRKFPKFFLLLPITSPSTTYKNPINFYPYKNLHFNFPYDIFNTNRCFCSIFGN